MMSSGRVVKIWVSGFGLTAVAHGSCVLGIQNHGVCARRRRVLGVFLHSWIVICWCQGRLGTIQLARGARSRAPVAATFGQAESERRARPPPDRNLSSGPFPP